MQTVAVDPISSRLGHYLGDDLIFALNGTGSQTIPKYHLIIALHRSLADAAHRYGERPCHLGDRRDDGELSARPDRGQNVFNGKAYVAASYDRKSQRFTDVRAARDAEIRDARTLADEIATQIAAELATRT